MKRLLIFFACSFGALATSAAADAPQGPAADVPELRVLNHWVGQWDCDMTVKPNAGLPQGLQAKGTASAEWVLGGRFVQQTATSEGVNGKPGIKVMTLMTYDPQKQAYRGWIFFSTGAVRQIEGQWDEATRTMTAKSRDADSGGTMLITATFADSGAETWSIVEKDGSGKVVGETSGKNTPRKK